jgi:hypothetical protein
MTADWESSHYNFFFWGEPFWGFCYGVIDDFRESVTQQRIVIWDGFETVERERETSSSSQAQYISQKGAFLLLLLFYFIIIIISEAESLNGPHFKVTPRLPPPPPSFFT